MLDGLGLRIRRAGYLVSDTDNIACVGSATFENDFVGCCTHLAIVAGLSGVRRFRGRDRV